MKVLATIDQNGTRYEFRERLVDAMLKPITPGWCHIDCMMLIKGGDPATYISAGGYCRLEEARALIERKARQCFSPGAAPTLQFVAGLG